MNTVLSKNFNYISFENEPKPLSAFEFTDVKIKKIALYTISALFLAGAAALVGVSIAGVVSWPLAFTAIPLIAAAVGIIRYARTFKDYEDPLDLHKMRQNVLNETFSQIIKDHGLDNVKKYQIVSKSVLQEKFLEEYRYSNFSELLRKYSLHMLRTEDLIPLKELQKKFAQEIQGMGISTFLNTFSVSDLRHYQIASERQLSSVDALLDRARAQNKELDLGRQGLNHKYSGRQECLLKNLDQEEMAARQKSYQLKRDLASEIRSRTFDSYPYSVGNNPSSWQEYRRMKNREYLNQEWETIPAAERAVDRMLSVELAEIQNKRQSILDRRDGEADQVRYNEEFAKLEKAYLAKMESLNQEFKKVQQAVLKEVSV